MLHKKSILRATAILSSSSVISILLSLVTAKILALYLQPEGYGYYGLLQSFIAVAALIAGMGVPTAIVRMGAAAVEQGDGTAIANLRRAAWLLFAVLGTIALLAVALLRRQLSVFVLGTPDQGRTILVMSLALLATVAANVQVGTLNAYHRVNALAKYGVANTIFSSTMSIGAVLIWRVQGVPIGIIVGALMTFLISRYFSYKEVGRVNSAATREGTLKAAMSLLRFGFPYTASMFVGTGVQLGLPIIVLHLLTPESVGYYRAAVAISVGYLGFLVTAMGQDYYPRVSAAAHNPSALVDLVNAQHRLVMLVAVPMILGTLALIPILVPIVYSAKFTPTVDILEWQLIGDIFKFASWTMSFAILARSSAVLFFLIELAGGIITLMSTWVSVRFLGLTGLGVSFLVTYVLYYAIVWMVIRREIPLVWTRSNKRMLLGGIAAAFVVRLLPSTGLASLRTPIALGLALAVGIPSAIVLWREFRGSEQASTGFVPREEKIAVEV